MPDLVTHLWFDNEAEDAANFYASVFKDAKVGAVTRYPKAAEEVSGKKAGSVLTVEFEIGGRKFVALNGGPDFKFSEAVSLEIPCKDQAEIDYYWNALTADGGEESMCGWCKDKFGFSWQVVPTRLNEMMSDPDQKKVEAATAAFLEMRKLDLAAIEKAYGEA